MGSGASSIKRVLEEDPEALSQYRAAIARDLASELKLLSLQNLSEEELKERIVESLKNRETLLLEDAAVPIADNRIEVAPSEDVETPLPPPLKIVHEPATRVLEERSIYLINKIGSHSSRLISKMNHHYLCCVDGSEGADQAFKTVCRLMKKNTRVTMFHAFKNSALKSLPPIYTPEFIRSKYESQLIGKLDKMHYTFAWEERSDKESAIDALQNFINRLPYDSMDYKATHNLPDFVVLGYVGRKGPKGLPPPTISFGEDGISVASVVEGQTSSRSSTEAIGNRGNLNLGSTVLSAIRSLHLPCIICKKALPSVLKAPSPRGSSGRHYVNYHHPTPVKYIMAVNNSKSSKNGLDILFSLVKACDTLLLIHVKNVDAPLVKLSEFASETTPFGSDEDDDIEPSLESAEDGVFVDDSDVRLYYKEQLRLYGPKSSKFKTIKIHASEYPSSMVATVEYTIVSFVNKSSPDFFAIAPRAKMDYSSITEYVISNVQASIILCRN